MNLAILVGRLTADPETRASQSGTIITTYTLAVDRRGKEKEADFIRCKAFNRGAEFAEKYFRKGMRVAVSGSINTGSYKDKEGRTVYTTDVLVNLQEFADGKAQKEAPKDTQGFMDVPDDIDEELPFS